MPAGVAVQVSAVEQRDLSSENRVSGSVTSENETSVYVGASAKCLEVYFEAGDTVKKGDVICRVDLGSTLSSYNAAKISYDSALASYEQQKELFERQLAVTQEQIALTEKSLELQERTKALKEKTLSDTRELFAIGAASQLEIDSGELELDGLNLDIENLRLQLENLQMQVLSTEAQRDSTLSQLEAGMENTTANLRQLGLVMDDVDSHGNVIAPAGGTLASLNAQEGGYLQAGYPVAVISNAEQTKITVQVSEALMPKLAVGDAAKISVAAADAEFTGVIRSIDSTANPQTRLYAVTLSIPAEQEGLTPGMFADVTFYTETSEAALVIPTNAILTANGEQYVFVVKDGKSVRAAIETGLNGDGVTEVISGLNAGDELVVVGQQYLSDGEVVRVVSGG